LILIRLVSLFVLLLVAGPVDAAEWRMQGDGEFLFEVTFEGVGTPGQFKRFDIALKFDPKQLESSHLRVSVELTAADMGDPEINAIIADPIWFDAGKFPKAVFESKRIEARGPGKYLATGLLNLKGISKTVTVPFSWSERGNRANMRGEFVVQRIEFSVGSGEWSTGDPIGIDVKLKFDLTLKRKG
jgi:polyisoprenoid-binding protein YceI